jgi:hypothetical protein
MTLALTPVTWAPVDGTGQPLAEFSVTFTPTADALVSGVFVSDTPVTVRPTDDTGSIATDLVPGPYTVTVTVGEQETAVPVTVPTSLTAVDLGTLFPVPLF